MITQKEMLRLNISKLWREDYAAEIFDPAERNRAMLMTSEFPSQSLWLGVLGGRYSDCGAYLQDIYMAASRLIQCLGVWDWRGGCEGPFTHGACWTETEQWATVNYLSERTGVPVPESCTTDCTDFGWKTILVCEKIARRLDVDPFTGKPGYFEKDKLEENPWNAMDAVPDDWHPTVSVLFPTHTYVKANTLATMPGDDGPHADEYQMNLGRGGCDECHNKRMVIESLKENLSDDRAEITRQKKRAKKWKRRAAEMEANELKTIAFENLWAERFEDSRKGVCEAKLSSGQIAMALDSLREELARAIGETNAVPSQPGSGRIRGCLVGIEGAVERIEEALSEMDSSL